MIAMRYCRPTCCAGAVCGHIVAAPPRRVMNSRRLMLDPKISGERIITTKPTVFIGARPASLLRAPDVRVKRRNFEVTSARPILASKANNPFAKLNVRSDLQRLHHSFG